MSVASVGATGVVTRPAERVVSLDVFRGLTMALMIFVNDLAEIKGLPWWNYHAPMKMDAMTYVDMVFPAFLFILGMAVPLAIESRLKKVPSIAGLWGHVLLRSLGLLVLGLILANAGRGDAALMHVGPYMWAIIALVGAILLWMVYPRGASYATILRGVGAVLIVAMFAIYRHVRHDGNVGWISYRYPEILGLLAFAYLSVSALYIVTRRWIWAPLGWLVVLMGLCAATTARWIVMPHWMTLYVWPFGEGASSGIAMAGVVLSVIFFREPKFVAFKQKALAAVGYAAVVLVAGFLLTPLGISKIRGTPTWCLYSIGASVLVFTLLYWICDVKGWKRWAAFTRPAGSNTLLTYLVPDLFYFVVAVIGSTWFETHWSYGLPGLVRALVFTAAMLAIAAVLTRLKVRLQL